MASVRDWLQLFRTHTSPLEMSIVVLGAALGAGGFFKWEVLLWVLFGWLYHNAGYGHNSVEDFARGFDKHDLHKLHHPLQRGVISVRSARIVTYTMIGISFIYGMAITGFDITAVVLLVILTVCGFIYNIWGKNMVVKFMPIALAHSLLFPIAYFGSGGEIDWNLDLLRFWNGTTPVVVWGTLAFIFQIVYQILVEGDLKDLDQNEASLLRTMGVRIDHGGFFRTSVGARVMSMTIKAINVFLILKVAVEIDGSIGQLIVVGVMGAGLLFLDHRLMIPRCFDHPQTLKDMSFMEVGSVFAMIVAISPCFHSNGLAQFGIAIGVMVAAMVYFVIFNRILWGTVLRPRV